MTWDINHIQALHALATIGSSITPLVPQIRGRFVEVLEPSPQRISREWQPLLEHICAVSLSQTDEFIARQRLQSLYLTAGIGLYKLTLLAGDQPQKQRIQLLAQTLLKKVQGEAEITPENHLNRPQPLLRFPFVAYTNQFSFRSFFLHCRRPLLI